jgi:hypothetical protein
LGARKARRAEAAAEFGGLREALERFGDIVKEIVAKLRKPIATCE